MKSKIVTLTAVSVFLLVAGCGAGIRNSSTGTAPTVVSVGAQTNGVATNRSIDVMFSTEMNPATISTSTFHIVRASDGKSSSGTVTYNAASRAASFTPVTDLDPLTAYNATITTGAENVAGDHLAADYNFSFTTRDSSDTSPEGVYATIPTSGQINVPTTSNIRVVFTEGADPNSVTISTFSVKDSTGNAVDGTVTYDIYTNYATFTPKSALAPGVTYSVTIDRVKDLAGVAMTSAYTFIFSTEGGGSTAKLVYQSSQRRNEINGWIFDPSTGTLTAASGSPTYTNAPGPTQLLVSPDRKFIYTIISGQQPGERGSICSMFATSVISYSIDHASGALTQIQTLPLNGNCADSNAAMDPTGQFLYVSESSTMSSSAKFIDSIKLDTNTGMMTLVPESPFASSSINAPQSMVIAGGYIYANANRGADTSGILIYQRDASSGSVMFQSSYPIGLQDYVAALPSGKTLYSMKYDSGVISRFSVDAATGALTQVGTTSSGAQAFQIQPDPTGNYVAVATAAGVYLFRADSSGGLTTMAGSPFGGANGWARRVMFDTSGSYFVTASQLGSSYSLNIYHLDNGTLSPVASTSFNDFPGGVAMPMK